MEILRTDGTWAEQQHEQWEPVETPSTPQQAYKTAERNPDEVAELYNLSNKLGVSQRAIKENIDVARKASSMPDFDKLQERAPVLVGQSRDAWFMSLAQDDLENLATVEERTAALKKQQQEQVNATATQNIDALSSSLMPGFVKRTDTFKEFVSGQATDRAGVLWEKRRRLILQGKDLPPDQLEYLSKLDAASSFETTKTGLPSFIPAASEFVGQMFESVKSPQVMERGLTGAITGAGLGAMASTPTAGLAAPVTATSGAVTGAGVGLRAGYFEHAHDVEAGQAFREFRTLKDGQGVRIDDKTAAVAAEMVGVVNATLETVGFSAIAKVVPGLRKVMSNGVKGLILSNPTVRKAFFDFIKNYAAAWTGEVTTEMAQELTNIVVGGVLQDESITKTITSPDTLAQLQDIAVKVGKGMAVMGLGGGGVTLAGDIKAAHRAKTEATARKQKFVDFATSAEASRLKERSPEAFGEFMQRVGQKHGVETVLLQADRVVETLVDQQGMTPQEVTAWVQQYGVSQQELATAMQTGGTVELEFGKVAANLGKDETITLFQDDFHLEHGETPINAVADSVQGESQTAVRIKELYEEEQQRLITPDLADQIISDITAQLKDANIKGDNPALSVMPIIARANVLAKLTGTDAAEHLQRFGITIQRQGFDEFAAEHQLDAAQFQGAGKIDTPEFKTWFGDSKVVGESGDPLVVYHGTSADIKEFDPFTLGANTDARSAKGAFFFSKSPVVANGYAALAPSRGTLEASKVRKAAKTGMFSEETSSYLNTEADKMEGSDEALDDGRFFSTSGFIGKSNVLPLYLKLENPLVVDFGSKDYGEFSFSSAIEQARDNGNDGVIFKNANDSYHIDYDETSDIYAVFSPEQIKSVYNNGDFNPNDPRISYQTDTLFSTDAAPRGAIISGEGRNLITLFEQANVSTFLHEMGHLFLNDLRYVVEKYGVQAEEWQAISDWLGIDGEITTEQHEQFARGFEAYLREGEAPVAGLRAAFRQFKSWLVKIYRTADALQVDINDDLRRVFDRLVATEEEIQQARELAAQVAILDEKFFSEVGATDAEKEEYRASVNSAEYSATEKKDKQRVGKLDDRLKEFRAQAKEEVKQEPLYKAMDELVEKGGIDKASVTRLFGKINLPNVKGLFKKDGLDIEHAAIEAGYESSREFVEAMSKAKTKQQWIEQRVAQLEIEHDQGLTTEEAIRTAQSRKQMELESKWLSRKEGQQRAALTRRALKVWADQTTAAQKLGDAIKITKLITASRKLRQQVIASIKKGDWTTAFDANEKARLNEALIAAHYRANAEYAKAQTRWKRAVKADVAYEYRQQINQLMLKHQMVSRKMDIDEGTKSLSDFLSDLSANLDDISALSVPVFGDWLGNDKGRATSEMTWGEVQELDDMLKFLVGRGREVKNGLLSDEKTAIADLAAEAVKDAAKMKGKKIAKHDRLRRKLQDVKESYFAGLRIPLWLFRQMDAWKNISKKGKAGVNETKLWGRLSRALDNYYVATEEMGQKITPHLEHLITSWKNHGADVETSVPVPDCFKPDNRQWTFEHIVMLALNMGNADNLQRLAAGFTFNGDPMTVEQMQELTGILSPSDWQAVQGIWDSINSLYPQIDAVHLKLNHFRMKKVDAQPLTVQTKDGQTVSLAGGYFPIRYDGSLSLMAGMWNEMSDLQSRQEAVLQTPAAKSGFAKQRTATGAKLPVKLSMSVLSEHLSDTLRYIHIAQTVRDVDRVTQHKTYQAEALRVLGPELYKMIRPSLKHMIRPDGMTGTRWEKSVQWAMQRSSSFFMAWNLVTVMKNFGGFFQAQARVGLPTMLKGYAAFMSPKHGVKAPKVAFDQIMALSPYMRARYQAYDNDFKRQMMKFKPEKKFFGMSREEISAVGYAGIVAVDSISFLPAWLGSYQNALEMFDGDIEQAVQFADTKIREMQPSGNALDLSHLQRSTEGLSAIGRLFAPFFGFAGNFGNLQRASYAALRAGEMPLHEYLMHTFLIGVAQPLAPLIVLALLRTGEPPDPEEIAQGIVSANMQGLPIVRDLVDYAISGGYGGGDVVSTPAMELVNIIGKTAHSATDAVTNIAEGEPSAEDIGKVIFGLSETASYVTGIPVSRVYAKIMKGYRQIEDGEGTAINLLLPKHKGE